jgi:hypothetical protein
MANADACIQCLEVNEDYFPFWSWTELCLKCLVCKVTKGAVKRAVTAKATDNELSEHDDCEDAADLYDQEEWSEEVHLSFYMPLSVELHGLLRGGAVNDRRKAEGRQ